MRPVVDIVIIAPYLSKVLFIEAKFKAANKIETSWLWQNHPRGQKKPSFY